MNRYGIIYKVTNSINNKIYIGQTVKSLSERRSGHYYKARHENLNTHFLNALIKYPEEVFIWEEIDEAKSREELDSKEIYWINYYNSIENGYNTRSGGETRKEDDKFAEACGSSPFLLYTNKGEYVGEFINKRDVERKYGINHSDITQMIKNNKGSSGGYIAIDKKNFSQEILEERTQAAAKKKEQMSQKYIAIDVKTSQQYGPFNTIKEMGEALGVNPASLKVSNVVKGKQKTSCGYTFKIKKEGEI